jgi:hypothetical protein
VSIETLTCIFVAFCTLVYVFYLPGTLQLGPEKSRLAHLRERKEVVYENLRDLHFEYTAGKFPESDYQAVKASLEEEAAVVLSEIDQLDPESLPRASRRGPETRS